MSFLSQVTKGRTSQGIRIAVYAQEKMGKTTLATGSPDALLVPLEIGSDNVPCAKLPMLPGWDAMQQLHTEIKQQLMGGKFPYRTIIYDSVTALERMIHEKTLSRDVSYGKGNSKAITMESALGGYGRAYSYANELFGMFLQQCNEFAVYGGINIVFTCHAFASKQIDPQNGEFDTWDILLHSPKNSKTYGKREMLTQWVDILGFLYEPMYITKGEDKVAKGMSANKGRVLALSRTPSYVAGNRYGMEGEVQIPKKDGWNYMAHCLYQTSGIDIYTR